MIPALGWLLAWASPRGIQPGIQRWTLVAMTGVSGVYVLVRILSGVPSGYGERAGRYFLKQLMVEPFATLGAPWSAAWHAGQSRGGRSPAASSWWG